MFLYLSLQEHGKLSLKFPECTQENSFVCIFLPPLSSPPKEIHPRTLRVFRIWTMVFCNIWSSSTSALDLWPQCEKQIPCVYWDGHRFSDCAIFWSSVETNMADSLLSPWFQVWAIREARQEMSFSLEFSLGLLGADSMKCIQINPGTVSKVQCMSLWKHILLKSNYSLCSDVGSPSRKGHQIRTFSKMFWAANVIRWISHLCFSCLNTLKTMFVTLIKRGRRENQDLKSPTIYYDQRLTEDTCKRANLDKAHYWSLRAVAPTSTWDLFYR